MLKRRRSACVSLDLTHQAAAPRKTVLRTVEKWKAAGRHQEAVPRKCRWRRSSTTGPEPGPSWSRQLCAQKAARKSKPAHRKRSAGVKPDEEAIARFKRLAGGAADPADAGRPAQIRLPVWLGACLRSPIVAEYRLESPQRGSVVNKPRHRRSPVNQSVGVIPNSVMPRWKMNHGYQGCL